MKKEPTAKRAKAQRPVQREPKAVLAELVEKLQGRLEVKTTSASPAEAGARGELGPNLALVKKVVLEGFMPLPRNGIERWH